MKSIARKRIPLRELRRRSEACGISFKIATDKDGITLRGMNEIVDVNLRLTEENIEHIDSFLKDVGYFIRWVVLLDLLRG